MNTLNLQSGQSSLPHFLLDVSVHNQKTDNVVLILTNNREKKTSSYEKSFMYNCSRNKIKTNYFCI